MQRKTLSFLLTILVVVIVAVGAVATMFYPAGLLESINWLGILLAILFFLAIVFSIVLFYFQRHLSGLSEKILQERKRSEVHSDYSERLDSILKVAVAINSESELPRVLTVIAQTVTRCFGADRSSLMLVDPEKRELETRAVWGKGASRALGARMKLGEGIAGKVALENEPWIINGMVEGDRFDKSVDRKNITSALCVPLRFGSEVVGVLNVNREGNPELFDDLDKQLLSIYAGMAAAVIIRTRSYREMEQTRDFIDNIVRSMVDTLFVVDREGKIRKANDAALRLLGYDGEKTLIGEPINRILRGGERIFSGEGLERLIREGSIQNCEVTYVTRTGTEIPMSFNASPMRVKGCVRFEKEEDCPDFRRTGVHQCEESRVTGIVAMARDVRETRKMLEELQQANVKLKNLDRLKTEFVSTVSHELRTPLTTIREGISQVLDGLLGEINDGQREFLSMAMEDTDRLSRIIGNLLDFSRLESGRLELQRKLSDISDVARKMVALLRTQAEAKNISLELSCPDGLPELYLDPDRTAQIFTNLIGNAVKFTPSGGKVQMRIVEQPAEIEVTVADTGIGILPADYRRIFERFEQISREGELSTGGTGLGLAITKELVEMHGGRIWVESEIGRGSRFIFVIPKYEADELFAKYLEDGVARARKQQVRLALIVMGIENFDRLREKHGLETVNRILHELEEKVRETVRVPKDVVSRFRKGEIIVVLAETERKGAEIIRKRIEEKLGTWSFSGSDGRKIETRVRFGISTYPEESVSEGELLTKAEEELAGDGRKKENPGG